MNASSCATREQSRASTSEGSRWLSACAGSGKTTTLAARVRFLLDCGEDPKDILALVFSRAAAEELRHRIGHSGVPISTFHAYAARLVVPPTMRVATEVEAEAALRSMFEGAMRRPARQRLSLRKLQAAVLAYDARAETSKDVDILRRRLADSGLVPLWTLVRDALDADHRTFAHVLVDEAQDATPLECRFVRQLAEGGTIFAVGDPRQAIFGWRGADAAGLQDLPPLELTRSFRFGPAIAAYASSILGPAIEGNPEVDDLVEQADSLSPSLIRDPRETLILTRTNHEAAMLERQLDGIAVHARRDPHDALAREADRFAEIRAEGKAVISTVHGAKGREADDVLVVDFPERDEEDRRVAYVAATRARRRLVLVPSVAEGWR